MIKKILVTLAAVLVGHPAMAYDIVISNVTMLRSSWEADKMCVVLTTGDVVKIDLTTEKRKAEYSLALSAQARGADLRVWFDENASLVGGCNTGTTVRQYGLLESRN